MNAYLKEAFNKGLAAAKKNAIPAIALQILAVALIVSYYNVPHVRAALDRVGIWNVEWSPWFGMILTMCFGGVIPLTIEAFQAWRSGEKQRNVLQVAFTLLVWGVCGFVAVHFYALQAQLFGDDQKVSTIIKKVLVDQFIYVPLYVTPSPFLSSKVICPVSSNSFIQYGASSYFCSWVEY